MSRWTLDRAGGVSMLSVLVFSIIITIVATSYIGSVTSQQKNAINYDLSSRAYYAAESGVQDAVRALRIDGTLREEGKSSCEPSAPNQTGIVGGEDKYGLMYTCQMIDVTPADIRGSLEPGSRNVTIKLNPNTATSGPPYRLVLKWSSKTKEGEQAYYPRGSVTLPVFSNYRKFFAGGNVDKPVHALVRANIINHPNSNFTRDNVIQRVSFLNPTPEGGDLSLTGQESILEQQDNMLSNAECYASNSGSMPSYMGNFSCRKVFVLNSENYNMNNNAVYLRLSAMYRTTDFEVGVLDSSGNPIRLAGGDAVIDVTGRAGKDIFRRIQQRVSLGGYREDSLPDAAVVAGEGLCKWFSISDNPDTYLNSPSCNPLE